MQNTAGANFGHNIMVEALDRLIIQNRMKQLSKPMIWFMTEHHVVCSLSQNKLWSIQTLDQFTCFLLTIAHCAIYYMLYDLLLSA